MNCSRCKRKGRCQAIKDAKCYNGCLYDLEWGPGVVKHNNDTVEKDDLGGSFIDVIHALVAILNITKKAA